MQKPNIKIAPGKIMWLPVIVGFLVDNILSLVISLAGRVIDPNVVGKANNSTWTSTTGIAVWIAGIVATGIGGFVAGRLAKHERVLHGVLVGGCGIGLMLVSSLFDNSAPYNGLDLTLQFLATALAGLGGLLSQWIPSRQDY